MVKLASDLMSKYVGETEQNMARMFEAAAAENAVLLLDEADSFLRSRRMAERHYEVSEVNEMLAGMERFAGLFICTTNAFDDLDEAALRRFGFKIRFKPLRPDQRRLMFEREVGAPPDAAAADRLAALDALTPGDFAAVRQQAEVLGEALSPDEFLILLEAEHRVKPDVRQRRPMGFRAGET
jgi:SpoVK/Ycf46/Vps4 family AAA+-type ATPase